MKKLIPAETINRLASDPANCTRAGLPLDIDMRRPFVPEHHTQLYFTPLYASLHFEHRLRYNQIFALRINEYIMALEADLVERLLTPLKAKVTAAGNADLIESIDTMIAEERLHYAQFATLNRASRPDLYPKGLDRLFSQMPLWTKAMFWAAGAMAGQLAFSLWYLMAMEESSMTLAREMSRNPETETLGALDPSFVSVHVEHMKDEARHLHIDAHLIALCIGQASRFRRASNAKLFQSMLTGITTPTRSGSGVKVIRQLVRDMPELQDREEEMIRAVLALKHNKAYQASLFNRQIMPSTFQLFDQTEELSGLGGKMVGYDRH